MKRASRLGFSVFELLVLIAIIGILIGLLLPAVVKVREAANRTKSMNNIRQISIAVHNYNDSYNKLPQGNDAGNYSAAVSLLPFLEENQQFPVR